MLEKIRVLIKDILFFALGSFGSKLILFFLVPIYTNFLSVSEYGIADYIVTASQLIIPFVSCTIYNSILRFGLSNKYDKSNVLLNGLLVLIFGSIILFCATPILNNISSIKYYKWYLYLYITFNMFYNFCLYYLKITYKNKLFSLICIMQTLTLAISNVLLICFKNYHIHGYLISMILSNCVPILITIIVSPIYKDIKKGKFEKQIFLDMILFSLPMILNDISWWVLTSSNKFFIELYIGEVALGIYAVASKIPSIINVVNSVFNQAWSISSIKENETSNDVDYYSYIYLLFSTSVCLLVIIVNSFIKPFMKIYVGSSFLESWVYVPFLLCGAAFGAISSFFGSMYIALKKSINNTITTIISSIVNITINLILIRKIGIWGAVISTLISYFSIAFIRMMDLKRISNINIYIPNFVFNTTCIFVHSYIMINYNDNISYIVLICIIYILFNGYTIIATRNRIIKKL